MKKDTVKTEKALKDLLQSAWEHPGSTTPWVVPVGPGYWALYREALKNRA